MFFFSFFFSFRYWYENTNIFTADQLIELEKHTLARVLCDSGDNIEEIQSDVFERATYPNDYLACDQIPAMNLTLAWVDDGTDECT